MVNREHLRRSLLPGCGETFPWRNVELRIGGNRLPPDPELGQIPAALFEGLENTHLEALRAEKFSGELRADGNPREPLPSERILQGRTLLLNIFPKVLQPADGFCLHKSQGPDKRVRVGIDATDNIPQGFDVRVGNRLDLRGFG